MGDPLQFLLGALVLLAVPGPTNTLMALAGAGAPRSPLPFVVAALLGYGAIIGVSSIVLLPLLAHWPGAATIVKLVVAAYLVYLAYRLWLGRLSVAGALPAVTFRTVLLTTFLNPKGLIVVVAVLPMDAPHLWAYALSFAMLVAATSLGWFWLGTRIALLSGPHRTLAPDVGAVALLGFAALIAVSAGA